VSPFDPVVYVVHRVDGSVVLRRAHDGHEAISLVPGGLWSERL
jgi:hypothetical protein